MVDSKGKFAVAVWHAPNEAIPERLMTGLRARGIATVGATSIYGTLAEACRLHAAAQQQGLKGTTGVVVVYPERLEGTAALWDAVRRYAPGTRLWVYGPESNPKTTEIVEPVVRDEPKPSPKPAQDRAIPLADEPVQGRGSGGGGPGVRPFPGVEPKLKLTESGGMDQTTEGSDLDGESGEGADRGSGRRPLLTTEELSMLLGEGDTEENSGL